MTLIIVFGLFIASADERVNLINDDTFIQQTYSADYEDGILDLYDSTSEYIVNFSVPNLTNDYIWKGTIKINEIDTSVGFSGVRFCLGYDEDTGNYVNLIITRTIGLSANQRGASPVDDIFPLDRASFPRDLVDGMIFTFEIARNGQHVVLKIDDEVAKDFELPEEYNLFSDDDEFNLGFIACRCAYEVSDLEVWAFYEPPEETPTPKPTEEKEETSKPTEETKTLAPSPKEKEEKDTSISPLVIVIFIVALVLLAASLIFIVMKKKKS